MVVVMAVIVVMIVVVVMFHAACLHGQGGRLQNIPPPPLARQPSWVP
jgi:hypothetical protein